MYGQESKTSLAPFNFHFAWLNTTAVPLTFAAEDHCTRPC
jgi:hypothetical protein